MATILETDENGALMLSARVLGHDSAHARYILEEQRETLVLHGPDAPESKPKQGCKKALTSEEWQKEWDDWSEQVTKAWQSDKSAAEIVAEMRR